MDNTMNLCLNNTSLEGTYGSFGGEVIPVRDHAIMAAEALRRIARDPSLKASLLHSPELYQTLLRAAKRFIAGDRREDGIRAAAQLHALGYRVSAEFMGENTATVKECIAAKQEFLALMNGLRQEKVPASICLDLSHIGLFVDYDLALSQLLELADEGRKHGLELMVSMEEHAKCENIVHLYKDAVQQASNIGITIQAHLHRSEADIKELVRLPGKIRLVKGAFLEAPEIALPRSEALNERYLSLVDHCVQRQQPLSIATHDEVILNEAERRGYLEQPFVEVEMLYGVRPDLIKIYRDQGISARVYVTYGTEWFLYLCHRLAEHPANLFTAVADLAEASGYINISPKG
ncbi:proline dehydrogenase family protein [Paenibacillus turpanensis]|uniref:proline dehydrogenase family protein n=1 Tax=Paenibacillus turpanensis TaxID=2689078 RepID=UPI001FB5E369|nr:proline dehydrogenase family protein [Paenibacillus turpanensis]